MSLCGRSPLCMCIPTRNIFSSRKNIMSLPPPASYLSCHYSTLTFNPTFHMKQIKLITLDVTGTLLTFRKPPFEIYAEFGKRHGLGCNAEEEDKAKLKSAFREEWKSMNTLQPHFGLCWESWWTDLVVGTFQKANVKGSTDHLKLKRIASELIEHFKTDACWKLKPGAKELTTSLRNSIKEKNNKSTNLTGLGIISNFDPRLHILLQVFQLENTFNPIILSHERQMSKPSPEVFHLALREFNERKITSESDTSKRIEIQPCEALHVGDNYELDYVAAINAGWKACLIGEFPAEHQGSIRVAQERRGGGHGIAFPDLKAFHSFLQEQGTVSA